MSRTWIGLCIGLLLIGYSVSTLAQQSTEAGGANSAGIVPPLVSFSGVVTDLNGKPLSGVVGITFALYKEQEGGVPLWSEMQNVYPDKTGHYTVSLGSTSSAGLPADIFAAGEARWLGVQPERQPEQPRILLLSVPYALKAADAQTVGGLPPSAFVLAAAPKSSSSSAVDSSSTARPLVTGTTPVTTAGGTVNQVPLWDSTSDITSSVITQTGSGSTAKVGIGTTTPAAKLDVKGAINTSSSFNLGGVPFAFGSSKNWNVFLGFAGNSKVSGFDNTAVGYEALAQLTVAAGNTAAGYQALEVNTGSNNTATGSGALRANTTSNGNTATGTGSLIANITGAGNTAIGFSALSYNTTGSYNTAVGLTAGPDQNSTNLTNATAIGANAVVSESNALVLGCVNGVNSCPAAVNVGIGTATPAYNLDVHGTGNFTGLVNFAATQTFPGTAQVNVANTFTGNQTVDGNLSATGVVTGSSYQIGSNLFAFGMYPYSSAFDGFAGNAAQLGSQNTGTGYAALSSSALTGGQNTADGANALYADQDGTGNTAVGFDALDGIVHGQYNTAVGFEAMWNQDVTGNTIVGAYAEGGGGNNTALGMSATVSSGSLTNTTTLGAYSYATQSNTVVLGCVASVNYCPAQVQVGIGTTAPDNLLTVNGSADKPGGGSWGTYSDQRLKTLQGSFNSGLSQIMKLHPVRYRYKKENALGIRDEQEHVGLVAQDVQKVIPEAVEENSKGYLLLNNDPILWSMLNAIQQQQGQIRMQQAQIRTQRVQLEAQQAQNDRLKAQIARLALQVKAIQTVLSTNGENRSAVRSVKARLPEDLSHDFAKHSEGGPH